MFSLSSTLIVNGSLWVLAIFSVATWTVILYKSWQYWQLKRLSRRFEARFWDAPDLSQAAGMAGRGTCGPLARVAASGFGLLAQLNTDAERALKYVGEPRELLERSLRKQMQQEQRMLESGLTLLASIGSTAPFVGLFGTVWGIMHALQDISRSGSASLDVVAGPVGEALVATAIGIAVAVPAVLAYNFFLRRAKVYRFAIENFADDFARLVGNHHFPG